MKTYSVSWKACIYARDMLKQQQEITKTVRGHGYQEIFLFNKPST